MPENLVTVRDLHFNRGSRTIYSGVDIDIRRGKITAILGPSGTGKTTLLRLISGQLKPGQGTVEFDGQRVADLKRSELFELRKRLGMLFQTGALLTDLSVFENVAYPLREHSGKSDQEIYRIVLDKLEAVGLRNARNLMPSELSGGMARRVALARAIALGPDLVMYDEPFTGQDPISMGVLIKLIRSVNDELGITSVVVSHDVNEVLSIADYAYIVADGKVVCHGDANTLRDSQSDWVQQFLNGRADGPVSFHYPGPSMEDDLKAGGLV